MLNLPGYKNLKLIQEGATTVIYRGQREEDEKPAIVKILKHEYPTLEEITRLKHEYEIAKDLDLGGIIKPYSLENYQNGLALILEDFGGRSLQQLIWDCPIGIGDFLNIAIQLASTLGELHKNNIIHKDIKPSNIIINSKTLEIKLTDFRIASRLVKQIPKISNPKLLEGTLAYMSPEQTGRMNRSLDYRTDFYSLGVTFYEIITGKLPFQSTDPLELIHCHIAKVPTSPDQIIPEIPQAISNIVMKLLAKTAEERYQSAWGLKADLETCLTQLQTNGKIDNFSIDQLDYASQLIVPQKLDGRPQAVAMQPLNLAHVRQLIADGFKETTEKVNPLGDLIFNQTGENPFFLTQLIQELKRENLLLKCTCLETDRTQGKWECNLQEIQAIGITNKSAVELVGSRNQKLPVATQKVLKLAACVGNRFTLDVLATVNQLNLGIDMVSQQSEKDELARLNLIAGRNAKAAIAYELAFKYLNAGLELLSANAWDNNYDLTLALYVEAAEAAYLSGEYEQMQKLAEIALQQAKTLLDKIKVYECKILAYVAEEKLLEGIEIALQTLKLLGVEFPEAPTEEDINRALAETASLIPENGIEGLMNLPRMTDEYSLAAMQILSIIIPATYHAAPTLYLLIVLSQVNLSITQGNAPISAFAYSGYGLILCAIANNIELGYQFGQLALNLLFQFNNKSIQAKVLLVVATFILHWKSHLQESLSLFQAGYQSGLESGDLETRAWHHYFACQASYLIGEELSGLERKIESYRHGISQIKQQLPLIAHEILHQVVLNLIGRCVDPCRLIGEAYNEEHSLPQHQAANDLQALYYLYLHKLILCYLFGNYPQALENATLAAKYVTSVPAQPIVPYFYFYDSLVRLAMYPSFCEPQQNLVLRQVQANQQKMRFWSRHSPCNYKHKYELVEAEKARALGQNMKAMEYYDRAIQEANEQGYIQEEALANELAALFYLSRGRNKIAKTYMTDAYYGYIRWGSSAKVKILDEKYPQLISRTVVKETDGFENTRKTTTSTTGSSTGLLDLASVMKSTYAISSEIVLEKLLENLIKILIENAAAQKGILILVKSGKMTIEAVAEAGKDEVLLLQSLPVETSQDVPASVINYVARTQEDIVLNHATKEGIFTSDRYILNHQVMSLLCAPILYQGKLIAILYLENNLSTDVFTKERLEVLKLLTSQVAISIENSLLYQTLEEKVLDRTRELQEKNEQLLNTLQQLKTMQKQIIAQEKLASLGALTAGIAHEIKNPLNFVNNFAEVSAELIQELALEINSKKDQVLETELVEYIQSILNDLEQNLQTINKHGKRADTIVRGMLSHSRNSNSKRELSDLNALLSEAVQLAYHGMRGKDVNFSITLETDYDDAIGLLEIVPQDISRVFINMINNACYVVNQKKLKLGQSFESRIAVKTKNLGNFVEIRIKDNGFGIPPEIGDKIFHPFFTTKPTGEGTGLGLSISHDIIVGQHRGEIKVETEPGLYTEFIIVLPKFNA